MYMKDAYARVVYCVQQIAEYGPARESRGLESTEVLEALCAVSHHFLKKCIFDCDSVFFMFF